MIRFLLENEIPQAVELAKEVFDLEVREYIQNKELENNFDNYVSESNISLQVKSEELKLWGYFEEDVLVAVSAMQMDGHITMLYVKKECSKKGYGLKLLNAMRNYAGNMIEITSVSVNAMPSWSYTYFQKNGFYKLGNTDEQMAAYVPMGAKSICDIKKNKSKAGLILGSVCMLGFALYCLVAYIVYKLK